MSVRPQVRALPRYDFTPQTAAVKLDQNELPFDVPEELRTELSQRLAGVAFNRYPDLQATRLTRRLAEVLDWPAAGVIVSPGSNVLIRDLIVSSGLGRTVLTVTPTFGIYSQQAALLDARLLEVPLGADFALPAGELERELASSGGVLFIANPAAPTGNLHPRADLERLAQAAAGDWLVVIDEAYCQFAGSDLSDLARKYPHVVILRTLSKAFGLAGARLGFALAAPELAGELRKALIPFAVSELQQEVALLMLDHPQLQADRVALVVSERERVGAAMARLAGVEPFPSAANFILFRVQEAGRVRAALLERGIVVRGQSNERLQDCLRVSVGTPVENDLFLNALREVLAEVHGAQAS